MSDTLKVLQYEKLVRQAANSLGIHSLEIASSSMLRRALHIRFNDNCGRRQEVFVPFKTSPAHLRATLRYIFGPKPAVVRAQNA
jgi:hypothetical protein